MRKTALIAAAAQMSAVFFAEKSNSQPRSRPHYRKSWKLNRSSRWPYAKTYAEARAISPYPDRPVR